MTVELKKVRVLLTSWAKWKCGVVEYQTAYRSPPNMIYRLMQNDALGGGVYGSRVPYAAFKGGVDAGIRVDGICLTLDNVIERLPARRKETVYHEFLAKGLQKQKAMQMGISVSTYREYLNLSLKQIVNNESIKKLVNMT